MSKKLSGKKISAAGVGLAALAAAAAASYYFAGPQGKKHRAQAAAWTKQAKTDMLKKIKAMEKFSQTAYDQASREVLAKYRQAKGIKPEELKELAAELQKHWKKISGQVKKLGAAKPAAKKKTPAQKRK
ncbi:MAG TPA: hypothetical protein VHA30_00585 [Patescibacteria group bacterium]|nr:hypothetical protein [Patescibacteria group bacterium]